MGVHTSHIMIAMNRNGVITPALTISHGQTRNKYNPATNTFRVEWMCADPLCTEAAHVSEMSTKSNYVRESAVKESALIKITPDGVITVHRKGMSKIVPELKNPVKEIA